MKEKYYTKVFKITSSTKLNERILGQMIISGQHIIGSVKVEELEAEE